MGTRRLEMDGTISICTKRRIHHPFFRNAIMQLASRRLLCAISHIINALTIILFYTCFIHNNQAQRQACLFTLRDNGRRGYKDNGEE